jgi:thiamine biosynthesis protein ThiS
MIKVKINGKETEMEKGATIAGLIESYGFKAERVVAEVNGSVISRETYASVSVNDGDRVELINFVGGG